MLQYWQHNRLSGLNIVVLLSPKKEMPREYLNLGHESAIVYVSEFIK